MNEWCIEAMAEIPSISFLPQVRDDFKEKTKTLSSFKNLFFRDFVIVVQSLSCVRLFSTLYTTAYQASLSFTISWSLLKLMPIELTMPSNHFILCHPLPLLSSSSIYFGQVMWLFWLLRSSVYKTCIITPVLTTHSAIVRNRMLPRGVIAYSAKQGGRLNGITCKAQSEEK